MLDLERIYDVYLDKLQEKREEDNKEYKEWFGGSSAGSCYKKQLYKITYTKGSNIFGVDTFPSQAVEKRKMQTLESVVGDDATYDFIKQDVQGAELLVMQGSPEIFKKATYVLNEVNLYKDIEQPLIPDVKEMDLFMQSLGFDNSAVIADHGNDVQIDKLYWKN